MAAENGSSANLDRRRFSETVGLIYDCSLDPSLWPKAIENIAGYIGAKMGSIAVLNPLTQSVRFAADWGLEPEWMELLHRKYLPLMPFYRFLPQAQPEEPMNTRKILAMMPEDEAKVVLDSPFFTEWATPAGLRDCAAAVIWRSQSRFGVFGLQTPLTRDWLGDDDLALVAEFVPHVRRAAMIGDILDLKTVTLSAFEQVLDASGHAALVLGADGRFFYCNRQAEAMIEAGAHIASIKGRFEPVFAPARAALEAALAAACRDESGIGRMGLGVPLGREPQAAIAYVMPLARRGALSGWSADPAAAVLIKTGDAGPITSPETLAALFALTYAEARAALESVRSPGRAEAAAALGIGAETLKTHLSRVYDKTGTTSRSELALLLERLSPQA